MAPRTTWKGHLKLSLVSCPVRLYNAVSRSERVSFHLLHKDTHNRIQMHPHDPELGKVERSDLVKGYEYDKDQYVVMSDEDFDKIEVEASQAIVVEKFVEADEVDPIYLDAPYYLAPDGPVAEETFRVLHEAMRERDKVALARIVLSGRERLIALGVRGKGFLVTTLRAANEVRSEAPYFEDIGDAALDDDMLALAGQLIDQKAGAFDPKEFRDSYQEAVLEVVKAKIAGQEPVIAKAPERGQVVNLMDALKRSLEESGAKPPAESRKRETGKQPAGDETKPARGAAGKSSRPKSGAGSGEGRASAPKKRAKAS
jgi:DNA end-binding protein Ku